MYSEDIIISDSESSADFKASNNEYDSTNSSLELYTNLYSSIKVKIYGDYNKKTCEEYINFETYNSLLELANEYEDGEDLSNLVGYTYPIYLNINNSYQLNTLRVSNVTKDSTLESQTASGLVIEFADIITYHAMNDTATSAGGWEESLMRSYINNDIYNAIPKDIKSLIIDTMVVSGHDSEDSDNFTTIDKLYLLSPREINSDLQTWDLGKDSTRQMDYYANNNVSTSNYDAAKKEYTGSETFDFGITEEYYLNEYYINAMYTRTAYGSLDGYFFNIKPSGLCRSALKANNLSGVSPAFRIGSYEMVNDQTYNE